MIHLKTWPKYFEAVQRGTKTFEIRLNDRPYQPGVTLKLEEWDPEEEKYTGRTQEARVTYMTDFEQKPGMVVMGIKLIEANKRNPT